MSDDVLKQFVVALGWKVERDGERKFHDAVRSATLQAKLLGDAIEQTAVQIGRAFAKIIEHFDTLYYVSQRTGASAQNLRGLSYAFDQIGGSGKEAVGAVESFAKAMRTNPTGIGAFVRSLGVATQINGKARDSIDVLSDSIDAIQKRHPYATGNLMAGLLGMDEGTFERFVRYREEIKKYKAEYDAMSASVGLDNEKAEKSGHALARSFNALGQMVSVLGQKLLIELAPVIERVVAGFLEWVRSNPEQVTKILQGLTGIVERLATWLGKVGDVLADGAFLKGWDAFAKRIEWVASAISKVVTLIQKLDETLQVSSTLGKLLDFYTGGGLIGKYYGGEGEGQGASGGGADKPGLVRRGWNAVKRAFGGGSAEAATDSRGAAGGGSPSAGSSGAGAANPDAASKLADAIAGTESGRASYNAVLGNGAYGRPSKPISEMTLAEAREFGRQVRARHGSSSALGRYQIVNTTRDAAQRALGIGDDAVYNAETQDRMMRWIARNQGLGAWEGLKSNPQAMARARAAMDAGGARDAPAVATSSPIPKINISPDALGSVKALGSASAMGSAASNSPNNISMEHSTTINVNGAGDPATVANRVERSQNRVNDLSLRNAQTAIR